MSIRIRSIRENMWNLRSRRKSRSMSGKKHFILYPGLIAAAAAAGIVIAVIGCGKTKTEKAAETSPAVTETETAVPETSTVATASTAAPTTAAATKAAAPTEDPSIRKEVNGQIASYLTGEMKDVNVANRRPVAFMTSNMTIFRLLFLPVPAGRRPKIRR